MCPSLPQNLSRVEERVRNAVPVSLFLDFDGTLVPLASSPAEARLDGRTRETLARFAANHGFVTTIISGRALADLQPRIGLEGLIYAGNHGMEICGRQLHFVEPAALALREKLREISSQLEAKLRNYDGVLLDYKGLTATIHYRQAASRDLSAMEADLRTVVAGAKDSFDIRAGKMAFEVLPRTGWHKGAAARWINRSLGNEKGLSIYLGDDETDEDAFRTLADGITVKVGEYTVTSARYHLAEPRAVHEFLIWLENHAPSRTTTN